MRCGWGAFATDTSVVELGWVPIGGNLHAKLPVKHLWISKDSS